MTFVCTTVLRPGVRLGGASIAVDPSGEVIAESMDPVVTVQLDATVVADARRRDPGYLRHYPELYARGWSAVPVERAAT